MMAVPSLSASQIAAQTTFERPAFEQKAIFKGPDAQDGYHEDRQTIWALRAFRGPMNADQLVASLQYVGPQWIFYARALDAEGKDHPVVVIHRDVLHCGGVGLCTYDEAVGVTLPPGYLTAHAATGFRIRFSSLAGDGQVIVTVPPNYVQGFLTAVK